MVAREFLTQPFRNVLPGFVEDCTDSGAGLDQSVFRELDGFAIGLFGFNHEQHHIHETGDAGGGAGLADRRQIEDDVIEITRLELGEQAGKTPGQDTGQVPGARIFVDDIQVFLDQGVLLVSFSSTRS